MKKIRRLGKELIEIIEHKIETGNYYSCVAKNGSLNVVLSQHRTYQAAVNAKEKTHALMNVVCLEEK